MFGALIPLNAGLASINIYTQIGLVTLIGLISKHGILMVDFANKLQEEQGYSRREAIEHAAAIRLRPILMTTAAMVVAMVPLLIAKGAGAASRFDIGVVIAAGMTIGTLFTLFVTPAVYTYLARDHQKAKAEAEAALAHAAAAAQGEAGRRPWRRRIRPPRPACCSRRPRSRAGGGPIVARGACLQLGRCRRFEPRPRAPGRRRRRRGPKLPTAAE